MEKIEPETHNDNSVSVSDKQTKYKIVLNNEYIMLKDDPDPDKKCLELKDDTQVCDTSAYGHSLLPVPVTVEVENSVGPLEVTPLQSEHDQKVVPSGLSTDDVCVSGNSDTRQVNVKEHAKCTSGNTYQCDFCYKCFTHKSNLNIHMRIHTGVKPYKCNICDKTFNVKCNLYTHIRTHCKEKHYKCFKCTKDFKYLSYYKSHMRTHSADIPYKCELCDKSFYQSCDLETHMHTHTGDQPYKCYMCSDSFSRPSDLNIHIRSHTEDEPHSCYKCDQAYNDARALKRLSKCKHLV